MEGTKKRGRESAAKAAAAVAAAAEEDELLPMLEDKVGSVALCPPPRPASPLPPPSHSSPLSPRPRHYRKTEATTAAAAAICPKRGTFARFSRG